MNVLGIDIGGTKIFVGRYNQNLELEAQTIHLTEADKGKDAILQNLTQAINEVQNDQTQCIGISWAGFVDTKKGIIEKAPNIPALNYFELPTYLEKTTGCSAVIGNDARLFAFGEAKTQTPTPDVLLGIIIGTGVGSGLILEGKIFKGAHNFAGEIGHERLGGEEIETLIAGPGLQKFLGLNRLSEIDVSIETEKEKILKKIDLQFQTLCQWLANICLAFDPKEIVIGGGAGLHFWNHFETEIIENTNKKLKGYPLKLNLRFSKLENAGAIGAASLAWEKAS